MAKKNNGKKNGKKKDEQLTSVRIKDGLFWKEDFLRLPKELIIYISSGKMIFPKSLKKIQIPTEKGEKGEKGDCQHKYKRTLIRSGRETGYNKWFWCPDCGALRECYNHASWILPKRRMSWSYKKSSK
jgi:hypothetical protein